MLIDLALTKSNLPKKEGYVCGYAMFDQLPEMYVYSSKHEAALSANIKYRCYSDERRQQQS